MSIKSCGTCNFCARPTYEFPCSSCKIDPDGSFSHWAGKEKKQTNADRIRAMTDEEIGCYDKNVRIAFKDGTTILIGYCKPGLGVWWIAVEKQGTAHQKLTVCNDEDAEIYSDVFEIDAPILGWVILEKNGGGEDGN